jgi:hypothetical protein
MALVGDYSPRTERILPRQIRLGKPQMALFVGARLAGEGSLEDAFAGKSDRRTAGSYMSNLLFSRAWPGRFGNLVLQP